MPVRRGSAPGNGAARTSCGERYGAVRPASSKRVCSASVTKGDAFAMTVTRMSPDREFEQVLQQHFSPIRQPDNQSAAGMIDD